MNYTNNGSLYLESDSNSAKAADMRAALSLPTAASRTGLLSFPPPLLVELLLSLCVFVVVVFAVVVVVVVVDDDDVNDAAE